MIELITTIIELICTVIRYGLYISYNTGYFLVNAISVLQKVVSKLGYLFYEVFGAILESLIMFYQEIGQNFQNILRTVSSVDIITYLSDIRNIIQPVMFVITTISNCILKTVSSVVTAIHTVLLSPKYVATYIIKSVWSASLSIKETFSDVYSFLLGSIHLLSEKTRDFTIAGILFWINLPQAVYQAMMEIPIESMLSIILSCCLIYLFVRFYVIVFSYLYRQLGRLFSKVRQLYIQLRRHFTTSTPPRVAYRRQILPARRPRIRTARTPVNSSKWEENDRHCVICQERIKCILLLPCRHLCMCNECINTLQYYHNTCPICRGEIENTMQIFV